MLFDEEDRFYDPENGRYYQQGDIVLAPVGYLHGREVADTGLGPAPAPGEPVSRQIWTESELASSLFLDARLAPAVIVTHDCAMDKEFNRRYEALRSQGLPKQEAEAQAGEDTSLDPYLNLAPVVPLEEAAPSGKAQLLANQVNGYFPICESEERGLDFGVANLICEVTIERSQIVDRLGIMSADAVAALRYALARFWVYRAPSLTFEIESAVGKKIIDATVEPETYALALHLSDGEELHFVQGPGPDGGGGAERPGLE